jgi:hypothetical protein
MNKYVKRTLSLIFAVALIAGTFAGCAKVNYVTGGAIKAIHQIKDGSWTAVSDEGASGSDDVSVLETPFEAGTYGGVEFKDFNDVAAYYKEAYDYTKSLTAEYDENGNTATYYKLLGDEKMSIGDVMIDGKANAVVNKLVPSIMDKLFAPSTYGLVPCYNRNPDLDNNSEDEHKKADHDFRTTEVTGDDILDANITDNGDGTITMIIQPKAAEMSTRGDDPQGRFFEVLGDIGGVVSSIDVVSFAEGTAEDNVKVTYKGGTVEVKIDTKTKEIVEATYDMETVVAVTHANVAVIKNKSATLTISYVNHYPASDDYLKSSKGITRK